MLVFSCSFRFGQAAAAAASSAAAAAAAAAASAAAASAPAELTPKDLDALERKLVGLESAAKDLQNQLASLTKEKDAEIAKAKEARERVSQIGGELSKLRAQKTELEAEFNKAHEAYQTLVKIGKHLKGSFFFRAYFAHQEVKRSSSAEAGGAEQG